MDKKFELTNETIKYEGRTLYRIRALKDFGDVKKGDLGGFIKKESNLSQEGNCWISDNAKVYDNASICDNTKVYGNASICDNTKVYGNAQIYGNAGIFGNARILDNVRVYDNALIRGNVKVYGYAKVYEVAEIHGNAEVFGNAAVYGYAKVYGNAGVCDNAEIYNNAIICDNAIIYGDAIVFGNALVCGDSRVFGNTKIYDNAEVYGSAKICGNAILKENQVIDTGCCRVDLSKNLKENIRCQTNLFPQKDCVIAYKQVNKDLTSLYDNTFQYKIDEWIEVENPDMSNAACTTGLHFSNMNYWDRISGNTTYLMAKIMLDDIITVQRGKIRCKRAFIIDKYEIEN